MESRIKNFELRKRIVAPEEAVKLVKNGMTVAMGGYTSSGYPKVIAQELARRKSLGENLKINLVTGANVGPLDELLGEVEIIARRAPMCMDRSLAKQVNDGCVHYVEQQMSRMPQLLERGVFGDIDVMVVEALQINGDGSLIPTSSVGMLPKLLEKAKEVIVEINMVQPNELIGLHDIYLPENPPDRKPIPLEYAGQRIGTPYIKLNPDKVRYIVRSDIPDRTAPAAKVTETSNQIADRLFNFLEIEIAQSWRGYLPPFQTGFGNVAISIAKNLKNSVFEGIQFFCGGLNEGIMELLLTGKVTAASAGSIEMTPRVAEIMRDHRELLKEILVIRNGEVTNCAETVSRLGVIALNSGIETDIYGNVNASHIAGTQVINGIGGGAAFAQCAGLSVILLPSTGKGGAVSNIVPMVFHTDIGEHDVDVLITENGIADLRGRDEMERARLIIDNCAHPAYRDQLNDYLHKACVKFGGHHPQSPCDAFEWYKNLKSAGSMLK